MGFSHISERSWVAATGKKELVKAAAKPDPPIRTDWSENCVHQHDGWQVMFWDMPAALQLLKSEYPSFLETFKSYKRRVQQGEWLTAVHTAQTHHRPFSPLEMYWIPAAEII